MKSINRSHRVLSYCFAATILMGRLCLAAAEAQSADGFATVGAPVTGGAGGAEVIVKTAEELSKYADAKEPYVIYVSGTIAIKDMDTHVKPNKTIIGLGNDAVLEGGGLYLYRSNNVIIRNLTIKGSTDDGLGLLLSTNIWIDHCTFQDHSDGCMDIRRASDNITVSWCKFFYSGKYDHSLASLIGSKDTEVENEGKLHITYHHNWFAENVSQRMPSVRFGTVHVYNNYYSSAGNQYCVRIRLSAQGRIENNSFENVRNPWEVYITSPDHVVGKIFAKDNLETNVTWGKSSTNEKEKTSTVIVPGTDEVFTPPYEYKPDPADKVKEIVTNGAGAGKLDIKPVNPIDPAK